MFRPGRQPRYKDYAADIHSSGAHLLSLINDLLDIAKIEAGRMEISPLPLDARRTFDVALKLIGFKASEKRQQLTIHVEAGAPALYADERALKQMLINLVSNAVKFTPEGGQIDVVASAARNGGFQIMVRDNGPGIPREKLATIFTPFSQVDNRYDRQAGGTGLGLALVRGLGANCMAGAPGWKANRAPAAAPLSCCRPRRWTPPPRRDRLCHPRGERCAKHRAREGIQVSTANQFRDAVVRRRLLRTPFPSAGTADTEKGAGEPGTAEGPVDLRPRRTPQRRALQA